MDKMHGVTDEAMMAASLEPDKLTLIGLIDRPGIQRFCLTLADVSKAPASYRLFLTKWPASHPLMWMVILIPLAARRLAETVAEETGMRIADGVPTCLHNGGIEQFFVNHSRVFTIENDPNSPVYLPHGDDFILAEEARWIEEFRRQKGL